jgi:hypothetical protein
MSTETQKPKMGRFKWGVLIVVSMILLCTILQWRDTRPSQMAKRYLNIPTATKLDVIMTKTDHILSPNPTTHIYLEAEKNIILSIVHNNGFVLQKGFDLEDRLKWLNFSGAPTAEGSNLILYEKNTGNPVEYLLTTPENTQIWFVAAHY